MPRIFHPALFLILSLGALAQPTIAQTTPAQTQRVTPTVRVFQSARDAVVNITATQVIEVRSPFDEMFERLFDAPATGPRPQVRAVSAGSGFVIHPSGYIVTNAHVVARTSERKAVFADKREFAARIVAIDQERDLAVLKIDAREPLPTLKLGRSDDLMIGESVIAIGNPLGYQHTCTVGIVSALDRAIQVSRELSFTGLIQTDASINPGNSGGPLLNVLGELIGVNTAIRGDAQNIGFAIPVDHLRAVLPEMLDVERQYRIRTGLHLDRTGSLSVAKVDPDSPAAQAGVQVGDVVTQVERQPVTSAVDYAIALIGRRAGEVVTLQLNCGGKSKQVSLELAARPRPDGGRLLDQRLGIQAEPMSDRIGKALGLPGVKAMIVTTVERNSPAGKIGIERGDVLLQIGRHPATGLEEVGELLERITPGQNVSLTILRVRGNTLYRSTATLQAR